MTYDPTVDAAAITFGDVDSRSVRTTHPATNVALDFDAGGRLIAIEILQVSAPHE